MRGIRRRLKGVRGVGLRVVLVPVLFIAGQGDIGRSLEELLPELAVAGQLVYTLSYLLARRITDMSFSSLIPWSPPTPGCCAWRSPRRWVGCC